MADMTELERRANQYITEQVSKGIRREDVLADWIRSDNADLQKYAKGILVKDLNPDQAAAEATGGGNPPGGQPAGSSYLDMAKDMAPILGPAALTSAAVATGAYYYGKKKGQGIAPLSDFEAKKQELELERMQLQNDVERARLTQMANKGQSLETQAKFSEPTAIEAAANTTSVKVPSPATVEAETSKTNLLGQSNMTLEDIERLRAAQLKPATPGVPDVPPQFSPGPISPAGDIPPTPPYQPSTPITSAPLDAPAPTPTSGPGSPVTTIVNDTVKDMMQEEPSKGMYRDASGKMVYPPEMSPAARAGAEAFAQQYPQHAAALEAEKRFGILGAGSADNNLFNAYGPELRKQILNEVNQGQLAGVYENYPERINPAIKALPPESPIAKQLEALRANDPKGANRGPLGTSAVVTPDVVTPRSKASTALKTAGRAALLVAMADAANAANKGDYVGAAKIAGPALDPTGMLEAAVNPQSTARNLTSVSPTFGFLSQLIASRADERAKKAYAEKVGAGRGIAPPSAYQR